MRLMDEYLVALCGSTLVMSVGGMNAATMDSLVRTIRFPEQLGRVFTEFIGVVDEPQQIELLDALTFMVKHEAANAQACIQANFHRTALQFVEKKALWPGFPRTILKKILALLMQIAQYSVTPDDIRAMLNVFQSTQWKENAPDDNALATYLASMEMMARSAPGPSWYLDLSGDQSGFIVPSMENVLFPPSGYTLSTWIRVESSLGMNSPLFSFCTETNVGVEVSFMDTTLVVKSLDVKRNEYNEAQVPNALVKHQWQWICIVHTYRQFRGSKLDVYVNGDARQSIRFGYPNTSASSTKMKCYVGRTKNNYSRCLIAHIGSIAFFSQPLQASVIESIKSADDYDNVVLQFNAAVLSSSLNGSALTGGSSASTPTTSATNATPHEGLVFAFDARSYDEKHKLLLDASGNMHHGENLATVQSVRLRTISTFKDSVWQMGGPMIFLPLFISPQSPLLPLDLSECETITRPLGPLSIPKVISLIGETLRHSTINKFACRRSQTIQLMSLLLKSLPTSYVTSDMLSTVERLMSAVASDRYLCDDIQKNLLYNFQLWVHASVDIQNTIFDKLHMSIKKSIVSSSVISIRYMLRMLSSVYCKSNLLDKSKKDSEHLRQRVLETIRMLLYEPESWKQQGQKKNASLVTTLIGSATTPSTNGAMMISFDAARTLIFSMLGKPTNPDGIVDDSVKGTVSEVEIDAGAIAEHVSESDIPDLLQIVVDLSITPETQNEFLGVFERLGGLRIWLPLISTANPQVRRMTLRLLRTYINYKCNLNATPTLKPSLSAIDVRMIFEALNVLENPLNLGSFNEIYSLLLGIDYGDPSVHLFQENDLYDHAAILPDSLTTSNIVRHPSMIIPFLELLKQSPLHIRWVGLHYLKLLFGDESIESTINRRTLLQCYAVHAYPPVAIEAIFNSFFSVPPLASPSLFAEAYPEINGVNESTTLNLRDVVTSTRYTTEQRLNAAFALAKLKDYRFIMEVLQNDVVRSDQCRLFVNAKDKDKMPTLLGEELKTHLIYLLVTYASSNVKRYLTTLCIELTAQFVVLELKTNETAHELVFHPLTLYPSSSRPILIWLRLILDRITHLLDIQVPPRATICWRNIEQICSIAASVVFHFDPDITPPTRRDSSMDDVSFWKCRQELDGERELSEVLLNLWQRCASHLTFELDASFGRTSQPRSSITQQRSSITSTLPKRGSYSGSTSTPSALKPFPGGAMRQILGLVLRSMYRVIYDEETKDEKSSSEEDSESDEDASKPQRRRSRLNSMPLPLDAVFVSRLNKLDYFVQVLNLPQYVATKEETSLVHWFVLELSRLMQITQQFSTTDPRWMESARRCAEIITRCLQVTLASTEELRTMLHREDFVMTETEVYRRDVFYHEHLETLRDSRLKKRATYVAVVDIELEQARAAIQVVFSAGIQARPLTEPVWLKRVMAKEYDDWMKLERLLRWNIQHVWSASFDAKDATNWQLDSFTSSKWQRCRLLPDVARNEMYKKMQLSSAPSTSDAFLAQEVNASATAPVPDEDAEEENDTEDDDTQINLLGVHHDIHHDDEVVPATPPAPTPVEDQVTMIDRSRSSSILGMDGPPIPTTFVPTPAPADDTTPPSDNSTAPETKRSSMSSRFMTGLGRFRKPSAQDEQIHDSGAPTNSSTASTSSSSPKGSQPEKKKVSVSASFRTTAYLLLPEGRVVYGMFRLGQASIVFEGEKVIDEECDEGKTPPGLVLLKRRIFSVRVVKAVYRRRFRLDMSCGIEVYFVDGTSLLLGFDSAQDVDIVYSVLRQRKPPCLVTTKRLLSGDRLVLNLNWHATAQWVRREISTFEYLMALNIAAGRSYNDITQYPIFPWVIADYTSEELDFEDPSVFRDFSKPIGGQTNEAKEAAIARYQSTGAFPYHYQCPYSSQNSVLSSLVRMQPYTLAYKALGKPIWPPIASIPALWTQCTSPKNSQGWELIPEFYMTPHFLMATSEFQDVALPPWAKGSVDTFIRTQREALESDFVSSRLHLWIDLIFGVNQRGPSAVDQINVYHPECYPDNLNLKLLDATMRDQIVQRGTVPAQLFHKAHPQRLSVDDALEKRYPASHALASLSSRSQVRRYDVPSRHEMALSSIRFSTATATGNGMGVVVVKNVTAKVKATDNLVTGPDVPLGSVVYTTDESGLVLAKRYQNSTPDSARGAPFTLQEVEQWWRLPKMCSITDSMVFYEHMISCGYFDGSWRIHWSADGELLQRIAFHKQRILCMARSEDDVTGDVALAFGSEDCTISVWAISKYAASRPRRMFSTGSKKELPVGNLPWVLLVGHTRPVVSVALNVHLDIVASACKGHRLLLHSLRGSCPLHTMDLALPSIVDTSIYLTISSQGTILSHAVHTIPEASADWRAPTQSELSLVSINGRLISRINLLQSESKEPMTLLQRGVVFTSDGQFVITASACRDGGLDVRPIGDLNKVIRRIDTKRTCALTCFGLSQDERCVVAGYEDGSLVMYALHYGVRDVGRSMSDKKARAEEAAAFARASTVVNEVKELRSVYVPKGKNSNLGGIVLENINKLFLLSKHPCVGGDLEYEDLLCTFWGIIYSSTDALFDPSFERSGDSWSRLGFQRPDPTTDFRSGGLLSLSCFIYFASNFITEVRRMTSSQIPGSHEHTYPWGPVGINIACMLAHLLWKNDGELVMERENVWPIFSNENAFYMFFCEVFMFFDCIWCGMKAQYSSFSVVMEFTMQQITEVLKENNGSLDDLLNSIRSRREQYQESFNSEATASQPEQVSIAPVPTGVPGSFDLLHLPSPMQAPASAPPAPIPDSFNLLDLASPPRLANNAVDPFDVVFDPFASNTLINLSSNQSGTSEPTAFASTNSSSYDPFAGLDYLFLIEQQNQDRDLMNYGILHNKRPSKANATSVPLQKLASMGIDPSTVGAEASNIWSMLDDLAQNDQQAYNEFIASQLQSEMNKMKFTPLPGFVVKYSIMKKDGTKQKLFINCCAHQCIGLPKNPNNGKDVPHDSRSVPNTSNLEIPLAIGELRTRQIQGEECYVVDAVFNPWVLERSRWDAKFKMDAMQLASHWVHEEKGVELIHPGKLIKSVYKGGIGNGVHVITNDFIVPDEQPKEPIENQVLESPQDLLKTIVNEPQANPQPFELKTSRSPKKKPFIQEIKSKHPVVKKGFLNQSKARPLYPTGSSECKPASAYVNLLSKSKVVDLSTMTPPPKAKAPTTTKSLDDYEFEQLCLDAEPDLAPFSAASSTTDPFFNEDMAKLFLQTIK
ncbi:hypothetical protein THRCLA_00758 [Thraustotheca clavata]|uniref:BEACH domain-containing protein n=1 Tax=Thraustotheca clavata TaxID=74557 RepID=A0A1W0AAB6_9STRA|nr:hypothetical protein THRCLA_00758 [Thraustotheca clavata]